MIESIRIIVALRYVMFGLYNGRSITYLLTSSCSSLLGNEVCFTYEFFFSRSFALRA